MSNDALQGLTIGVWFAVAAIVAGVIREVYGEWPEWSVCVMFWPLFIPVGALVVVIAGLIWIGRAPVLGWRRWRENRALKRCVIPEAKVRP